MSPSRRTLPPGHRARWVARRPPETLPPAPLPPAAPRPTPRYAYLPRWGLRQDFVPPAAPRAPATAAWAAATPRVVWIAVAVLLIAAAAELATYLLLMVNRTRLVPGWSALTVDAAALLAGLASWPAVGVAAVTLGCALVEHRRRAYARLATVDPRPAWQVVAGCAVPIVGFFAVPLLLLELLGAQNRIAEHEDGVAAAGPPDVPSDDRRRLFIRWWWAGWVALTIVTVGCAAWRYVGGDLQHVADGVALTIAVDVAAAAFLVVTRVLLDRLAETAVATTEGEGARWVMVT